MKRLFFHVAMLTLIFTVSFADPLPFFDNFDDGDYDGWEVIDMAPYASGPSDWHVSSGVLTQSTNIYTTEDEYDVYTGTRIITGDTAWTDYSFNVELKSMDNDGVGLLFRYRDAGNYYRYLRVEDPANGGPFRRIERCDDSSFTVLAEDSSDFSYPPNFFCVTVVAFDARLFVFEEGELVLSAIDSVFTSGKIGFMCYANDGSFFDNVAVTPEFVVDSSADRVIAGPYLQNPGDSSMTIMWETSSITEGSVLYGLTTAYTDSLADTACAMHEVRIEGLSPETRYFYAVRTGDTLISGPEYHFDTKPLPTTGFRLGIWGDNRTDYVTHERVIDAMMTKNPDLAINVGDVVTAGTVYEQWIREYFWPARNLLKNTASYISIGNHEQDADWFYYYVCQPGNEHYFAVDYGPARLIFVDTNDWYFPLSTQYTWLADELSSVESQAAPWLLVFHHHPPYSEGWDAPGYDGEANVRDYLVPLYEDNDVDFCFAGHTHDYERGEKDGVAYVISGGGGSALDSWQQDWPYIDIYYSCYHYIIMDITTDYIIYRCYDYDNNLIDSTLYGSYVGVDEGSPSVPASLDIVGCFPNPFNSSTRIDYTTGDYADIAVTIHDIAGRQVAKLAESRVGPGKHSVWWNAESHEHEGDSMPSGIYFVKIRSGEIVSTRRISLVK